MSLPPIAHTTPSSDVPKKSGTNWLLRLIISLAVLYFTAMSSFFMSYLISGIYEDRPGYDSYLNWVGMLAGAMLINTVIAFGYHYYKGIFLIATILFCLSLPPFGVVSLPAIIGILILFVIDKYKRRSLSGPLS
jgi:hypothetical protein